MKVKSVWSKHGNFDGTKLNRKVRYSDMSVSELKQIREFKAGDARIKQMYAESVEEPLDEEFDRRKP